MINMSNFPTQSQAGYNISPMDQIGRAFHLLPALTQLLAGQKQQQQQQQQSQNPAAIAPPQQQNPQVPAAPQPSYAGTGYQGHGALPPFGPPQAPQMQLPQVPPASAGFAAPGLGGQMPPGLGGQLPGMGMPQRPNPYAQNNNPFAAVSGGGFGSGLLNPTNQY